MRVLRYEMKLTEFGYAITSCSNIAEDNTVTNDDCRNALPMSLSISEKYAVKLKEIPAEFVCRNEDMELIFKEQYQTILSGKHPDWLLYVCEVSARSIVLTYYNKTRHEQACVVLENIQRAIMLHVEVPHQSGKPNTRYDVKLLAPSRDTRRPKVLEYEARVFEYYEDSRRELAFADESFRKYADDKYVYVTEYLDL